MSKGLRTPATVLEETFDAIAIERSGFKRSFVLVDELLDVWGEANLAERLFDAIPRSRPWEHVADLFGILIWSTSDNGTELIVTTNEWLRTADDLRRVQVALHLDIYPFLDDGEMERVLTCVAGQWPEVATECNTLIESRRKSSEKHAGHGRV